MNNATYIVRYINSQNYLSKIKSKYQSNIFANIFISLNLIQLLNMDRLRARYTFDCLQYLKNVAHETLNKWSNTNKLILTLKTSLNTNGNGANTIDLFLTSDNEFCFDSC